MPESLTHSRIKEALLLAHNDRHDAVKLLIVSATRDPALLLEMTKPHLKAIAAGLIDHYVRHSKSATEDTDSDALSRSVIDEIASGALNLPRDKRKMRDIPPPKSTERQASTMRKLAAAFTRKKKD